MNRFLKKASSNKAEQIGRIDLEDDTFTIAADGDIVLGLVNGYRVIDANLHENPIEEITTTMASVIGKAYQDRWKKGLRLKCHEGEWDTQGKYPSKEYMRTLLSHLRKEIGSGNISHIKESPEALIESPKVCLDPEALQQNLRKYSESSNRLVAYTERLLEKTEEITRVQLVSSMWGVTDIIKDIDQVKANLEPLSAAYNTVGRNANFSRRAIERLQVRLSSGAASTPEGKKYIKLVVAPDIVNSFDQIRKAIPYIVRTLTPFYRLEKNFKALTGNPINWSIPGSLLEDFREAFVVALEFLSNIPEVEKGVMEPLAMLQNSFVSSES